ncbi:hypothetical protein GE09DRAFT_393861 [Coniochaeta sp. 2T2.1]|nr:hypothetical protein GE09DRAFT_393861 [Coniochaeta sp. 2T2.1]
MSIARAFTTRRVKQSLQTDNESMPQRSNTIAKSSFGNLRSKPSTTTSLRNKISAPIELTHTTNMLSYNAPDLFASKSVASTASSANSDDGMSDAPTNASSPPTSPDVPPQRSMSPEPNHLSCYFTAPGQQVGPQPAKQEAAVAKQDAPVIPQRAPSHTKKASFEALNRHRSVSRMSEQSTRTVSTKASFNFSSRSSSASTTGTSTASSPGLPYQQSKPSMPSTVSHTAPPPTTTLPTPPKVHYPHKKEYSDSHPFGQELAQVTELAEEFSSGRKEQSVTDELSARGLFKFAAEDYILEIEGLISEFLGDARPAAAMWI